MNLGSVKLTMMSDEMYRSYFREYENDPDLNMSGQVYNHYEYSEEKVELYIQKQRDLRRVTLAIMCEENVVGEIIIKNIEEHKRATMSISLKSPKYKNQGIGTAAERLAVEYVFCELDIPTLFADTLLTNTRSQHVLSKVGFVPIGQDKDYKYYRIDRSGR